MAMEREKFVAGCERTGLRPASSAPTLFDIIEPFADYAFNKSHCLRLRPRRLPDRLAEGEPPRRVPGRAAHLGQGRQGQDRPSTWPSAGRWASRCSSRTSTLSASRLHAPIRRGGARGRRAIPFGLSAVRNVGEGLVERIVAERDAGRPVRRLLRLLRAGRSRRAQQAHGGVADQGGRLRLARPPPPGPVPGLRADHRPRSWPAGASRSRAS